MTTKSPILVSEIRSKTVVRKGITFTGDLLEGHQAEIVPGEKIVLFGTVMDYPFDRELGRVVPTKREYRREFKIGDTAESDSFNLSYLGTIKSITTKGVTIVDIHGTHRLSLYDFTRRNYDLDVAKTLAQNERTAQEI